MSQSTERGVAQDVRLEDIIITRELPVRVRDRKNGYRTIKNSAEPRESEIRSMVEPLVRAALEICSAGTAGMSLLESTPSGEPMVRWISVVGALSSCTGSLLPRNDSLCGACLNSRTVELYAYPGRYFRFLDALPHPIVEGLVVPIHCSDSYSGTLWIFSHDAARVFNENDATVMTGLADLAAILLGHRITAPWRPKNQGSGTREALFEAERREDELCVMLGHELRNPLSAMVTALHLVRQGGLASRSIDMLERQVERLVRLVDELLDDTGSIRTRLRVKPNHERVEIRNAVARAVDSVRPSLYACRHTFGISLPEEPLWIRGDSKRLEDVIGTLLSHAARCTAPGGQVWLTATVEKGDAVISVSDNGSSIPADALPHVFESFRASEPLLHGSGARYRAGLALARRWVQMCGGRIEARSIGAGQGSEFIVRLPLNGHAPQPQPNGGS